MNVTPATLITYYPEFAAQTVEFRQLWIDVAASVLNETEIGPSKIDIMCTTLACHLMAIDLKKGGAPAGTVTSRKVGEIATTYSNSIKSGFTDLETTSYGRTFRTFQKLVFPNRVT